jgi:uncharacterized protein YkwD
LAAIGQSSLRERGLLLVLFSSGLTMKSSLCGMLALALVAAGTSTAALSNEAATAASQGLGPLVADSRLTQLAEDQARTIAATGQLSHGNFAGRMAQSGIFNAAENISMGPGSVAAAIARWKVSPAHNENMLIPYARRIGLARVGRVWTLILSQ